jgi:hypothetical protein
MILFQARKNFTSCGGPATIDLGKIKQSDAWPFKIVTPEEFLDGIAPHILQRTAKEPA